MYTLFHMEGPFSWMPPLEAARAAAVDMLRPTIRPSLKPELAALITACWHPLPDARPTARDVCEALAKLFPDADTATLPADGCCAVA